MCKGKYRHCAVRLKIIGVSTQQPRSIYFQYFGERAWVASLAQSQRPSTVLVALEYLDLHQKCSIFQLPFNADHTKKGICRSQPHFTRDTDVHHNLNVPNPIPKVYTIYNVTIFSRLHPLFYFRQGKGESEKDVMQTQEGSPKNSSLPRTTYVFHFH